MTVFLKDPSAVVDFSIDWGADYLQAGEDILASSWSIFPDDGDSSLAIDQEAGPETGVTAVFVSGGQSGVIYRLTNHISTSQGRADERSLTIRVEQQ
ncbi:hypothetical protein [Emcibacter nanhaiensis]|uniref:Uncharacterized protein n=1 Tax=Emcibacter nanhaiensis TaxID=1505037 RepID=A0A501PBG1_9PROT|nr:hypothetical protein [Emcibacter nanhaiensis]TPD57749.1 hypothetical protein FIV46_16740 [Emcibacter nanhaiensis]